MASEGKGTDPAWIYADRIPGNKSGTKCKFCDQTFSSGGISRFKCHLIGYDPHKSVRKCSKVPENVKREVTRWVRAKEAVHTIYKPLYEILRIVDTEVVPTLPILYDMFHSMKQKIAVMRGKQWVVDIINRRWEKTLCHPLHAAACYLNPKIQYLPGIGSNKRLRDGVAFVYYRWYRGHEATLSNFLDQLIMFRDSKGCFNSTMAKATRATSSPCEWWDMFGSDVPHIQKMALLILSQTTSASACERNWSTFSLIHTKQRNRLAYEKLEKLVYCHYNMRLKLCNMLAKGNRVNENDYVDLLDVATEPHHGLNDPLEAWIRPVHLDDEEGNPDPVVAEGVAEAGIDVERVLSEEVNVNPNEDDTQSDDAFGGTASTDSDRDEWCRPGRDPGTNAPDDGDDGGDGGGGNVWVGGNYYYGQGSCGDGMSPFSCEQGGYTTQDEDHGDRKAGHCAIGRHNINSRRRGAPSDQTESSGSDAINLSFESMSIATDHSGHSNESGVNLVMKLMLSIRLAKSFFKHLVGSVLIIPF